MNLEDKQFLKSMNERIIGHKKGRAAQAVLCTDDEFEEVMHFFEETAQTKQPYAAVDNTAVIVSYEELEQEFDETISMSARNFAKVIYEHWRNQRSMTGNRSLMPNLKFETNLETDDADPYVCFRRREVRQIRKTRGRDAQITEKLKKLRKEMEDARHLMAQVKRREVTSQEQLMVERDIFEQRITLKDHKRKLGIKENDEDLINQKVCWRHVVTDNNLLTQCSPLPDQSPEWILLQCSGVFLA
jgi:enhancer of polycomb-like protein